MRDGSTNQLEALANEVLRPAGAPGVCARSGAFERVIEGLSALITRYREADTEPLSFPPVMSRSILQTSGYLKSFPHLLGCVSCLSGEEAEIRELVENRDAGRSWLDALGATELVLTPAACYPLYPMVALRGPVPAGGLMFDVNSYCFRHEATHEPGRLQSFRMREHVCIGTPESALAFRSRWLPRAEEIVQALALPYRIESASDPFFGRVGKLMALSQVEQELKFELLIPVISEERPTACMSFNYHRDHFGQVWTMQTDDGALAHTACVAFGMDRLGLALFATHGLDLASWPGSARAALSL